MNYRVHKTLPYKTSSTKDLFEYFLRDTRSCHHAQQRYRLEKK